MTKKTFFSVMFLTLFTPLIALQFTGMEHILQTVLVISYSFLSAYYLSDERNGSLKKEKYLFVGILLLSVLVVTTRYEGLFLVAGVFLTFLLKKKVFKSHFGADNSIDSSNNICNFFNRRGLVCCSRTR